ncbi:hypothetical protein Trydic_g17564 [Trypoxylus dichotomus]
MDNTLFLVKYGYIYSLYLFWFGINLIHLEGFGATQVYEIDSNGSVDLSYKGQLDNIVISRTYNTSLESAQYVLRSEQPIRDVDINLNSLPPCGPHTYKIEDMVHLCKRGKPFRGPLKVY